MSNRPRPNVVSQLNPRRRARGSRYLTALIWLLIVVLLSSAALVLPSGTKRSVSMVALVFMVLAGVIGWLSGPGMRLSRSGREMRGVKIPW